MTAYRHTQKETPSFILEPPQASSSGPLGSWIWLRLGRVDPHELVISKRLRRDLKEYKAWQPHVVATMLGADKDMTEYILLNVENRNPFTRVMPASLLDSGHRQYDRKKYATMARRAA